MANSQWHPEEDQGIRAEAGYGNKLHIYLEAVVIDDGLKPEVLSRIAQAT